MDLRDVKEFLRDFWSYAVTFAVIIFIFTFIVAFHPVAGNSMVPTLEEGNVTIVSKLHQHLFKIKRNQIVVVKKNKKTYIKRIVGLPGEDISYMDNLLYIDGKAYKEEFLDDKTETNNFLFEDICNLKDCPNKKIPKGYYLVLGDNRGESEDSRMPEFGLVKKDEIVGIALFNIWPVDSMKKL